MDAESARDFLAELKDSEKLRAEYQRRVLRLLLDKTQRSAAGCLEFVGYVEGNGYSKAAVCGVHDFTHRHVFRAFLADDLTIPHGIDVCHSCDNRRCINPEHLFGGTRLENMRDAAYKGRVARGWRLPQSRLSKEDKERIVELAKAGIAYKDIASQYGVCRQLVGQVALKSGVRRHGIGKQSHSSR